MGKALIVANPLAAASGNEGNFYGGNTTTAEANTQMIATEAATFSLLGTLVVSGGSGTNTTTFRNNSAGGNQTVAYAGTGTGEDGSNTDAVSAGNPFNIAFTDTGTDPTYRWAKCNVEFASGHGSFHGVANYAGVVCDSASSTRIFPIGGALVADGEAAGNEANCQWLVREYTSLEAFQVNVSANARTNDSVFGIRVNGSPVGTAITYGAGVSGIQTVTGMGISLSPGDLVSAYITLLTGAEDITVRSIGLTFKSTSNGSEVFLSSPGGATRAASATATYWTPGGLLSQSDTTEANQRVKVGFAARCKNLRCYISANTYTGSATLKLMVNGAAQITTTITAAATGWIENTSDTFDIDDNDEISFEIDEGTSGSITVHQIGVSFGALDDGVTGTIAQTLPKPTQAASGAERITGTGAQTLPKLTQAASGTAIQDATGEIAQTLPRLEQAAEGTVTAEGVAGSIAQTLPRIIQAAAGTALVAVTGTIDQILPKLRQAASGTGGDGGGGEAPATHRFLVNAGTLMCR
jgi:hypothetical protein